MIGTKPEIVFIKPKCGRKVPIPQYMRDTNEYFGEYLPEEGLRVQKTIFWIRRKQDGDIEEITIQSDIQTIQQDISEPGKNKQKKLKEEVNE